MSNTFRSMTEKKQVTANLAIPA